MYNFSCGLLHELASRSVIQRLTVLSNISIEDAVPLSPTVNALTCNQAISGMLGRILWDQWEVHRAAAKAGNEWLFLPKGYASIVQSCPVKLAVYIHDIMPVIYADRYPGRASRAKQTYFERVYAATLKRARLVFTNTRFTRDEILRWARGRGIACPPIIVAGYGFFEAKRRANPARDQILLFVRPDPHKRTELALNYLNRWIEQSRFSGQVVCVGTLPTGIHPPTASRWTMLGRTPPSRVIELMSESRAVVHFSEYEGFGMPPVEAALAGAVPVFSAVPASTEVMAGVGCPFDNDSYRSFADAMDAALKTPAETVLAWSDILSHRHNWRTVGDRIVAGLQQG